MVFGLPGSGKSTFARELSSATDAGVINIDIVSDDVLLPGNYAEKAKQKVYAEMLKMAVINIGMEIQSKARELHLIPHFIGVKPDREVIRDRISVKRKESDADTI